MKMSRGALFKDRMFMLFWVGFMMSAIGDAVFFLDLQWMIVEITHSGVMMGTVLIVMGLTRSVLMLFGGVLVDRLDPRKMMVWSDWLRAAVTAGLYLLSLSKGTPPMWGILALALIFGAVDAVFWPARSSLSQRAIPKEQLTQANSMLTGTMQLSTIIGPVLGAMLIGWFGYGVGMWGNALTFAVSALSLMAMRKGYEGRVQALETGEEARTEHSEEHSTTSSSGSKKGAKPASAKGSSSFKQDLLEGLRFVWQTPVLLVLLLSIFFANGAANGVFVGMPFLANEFGVGATGLGHMRAGFGLGGVIAAVVLSVWAIQCPTPRKTMLAFGIQGVAMTFVSLCTNQWQVAGLSLVSGLASTTLSVLMSSVFLEIIPPHLMGRVSSVSSLLTMGSTPVAQGLAGMLVDAAGPHMLYGVGGAVETLAGFLAMLLPAIRQYRPAVSAQKSASA